MIASTRTLGHGAGLRREHYRQVIAERPAVDWFEVISENFMVRGGNPRRVLTKVREHYPVVLHGVSLSIGSSDPLDEQYLAELRALADEIEPEWVSDHVSWGTAGGRNSHDLLPIPYNEQTLAHVAARVAHVQERLGRRILLENPSSYVAFTTSTMGEHEFIAELARRADCLLLLDVNNVFVSAHNHGFDPHAYLAALPGERIGQIHLAGHSELGELLLDTHDHEVPDGVWALYAEAVRRFGRRATLIEWDAEVPPLERLVEETRRAARVEAEALRQRPRHA